MHANAGVSDPSPGAKLVPNGHRTRVRRCALKYWELVKKRIALGRGLRLQDKPKPYRGSNHRFGKPVHRPTLG